ncbi:DUF2911 domain-containing protein [Fulvivirga lutimaris]|uniref:DUF2911 domain-containing protein n=1 Tax=Fulvivirga lutimaris TaxID=1819566 RepID=UPI0012BB76A1|nr:DUF2911 domain-containing protein [Fulvivirga lutimaris]MTI40768.1 DUF2911 domain-containing protein [Fulvivirga lutimaris]
MDKLKLTFLSILLVCFALTTAISQDKKKPSPPDTAEGKVAGVDVKIDYHQPSAKGRKIMGDLVPYAKVWRTGANDATTIEISEDVKVEGKTLAQGKYSLFTIPGEKEWVIIFNKTAKQWGAYDYDEAQDALRVKVKSAKTKDFVETFNIAVVDNGVEMKWENTKVKFALSK